MPTTKVRAIALALALAVSLVLTSNAAAVEGTRIQDGVLTYPAGHYLQGQLLRTGYDIYGVNYQAHAFVGYYVNAFLGRWGLPPYEGDSEAYLAANPGIEQSYIWPYRDIRLSIKWNEAWSSNMDRDGDGLLDGSYLDASRIGTGAWQTNHMVGSYAGNDGKRHTWEYFEKVVAVPAGAVKHDGVWYTADGTEIGPSVFGSFALVQQIYNDPYGGYHGAAYLSPASPGLGYYAG